jgi:prepilin peptidase CpaA
MTVQMFTLAFCSILMFAAAQDVWQLRISNIFPVALVALYIGWVAFSGFEFDIWQNLVVFTFTFATGLFLFSRQWLGGGDVKLLASAALWFDLSAAPYLLLCVTLGGAAISLGFIIVRRFVPTGVHERTGWVALKRKGPIPYGLAIAAGAILCGQVYGYNPTGKLDLVQNNLPAMPQGLVTKSN